MFDIGLLVAGRHESGAMSRSPFVCELWSSEQYAFVDWSGTAGQFCIRSSVGVSCSGA